MLDFLRIQGVAICKFFNVNEPEIKEEPYSEDAKFVKVNIERGTISLTDVYIRNMEIEIKYALKKLQTIVNNYRNYIQGGIVLTNINSLPRYDREEISNIVQVLSISYRPYGGALGIYILNSLTENKLHDAAMCIVKLARAYQEVNIVDALKSLNFLLVELVPSIFSDLMSKMLTYVYNSKSHYRAY